MVTSGGVSWALVFRYWGNVTASSPPCAAVRCAGLVGLVWRSVAGCGGFLGGVPQGGGARGGVAAAGRWGLGAQFPAPLPGHD
jgi:hypothetical protein